MSTREIIINDFPPGVTYQIYRDWIDKQGRLHIVIQYPFLPDATLPVSPDMVDEKFEEQIPDTVILIFNELIVKNWTGRSATIKQKDVVNEIKKRLEISEDEIFERRLLQIQNYYRKQGWTVTYDRPGYNETYDAYFLFEGGNK